VHAASILRVNRINVVGSSGSGKTTVAIDIAEALDIPHLELDSIHHLPNWEPIDTELFRSKVTEFVSGEQWVVDGNYSKVRDLVWKRADTVVFLDLPRWRVMSRLVPRTLGRMITRRELWNGNRERFSNLLSTDPEKNLLVWSWTRHRLQMERFERAEVDPRWTHIAFTRLKTPKQIRQFLDEL
jgi:adenylate kinase family enzyme